MLKLNFLREWTQWLRPLVALVYSVIILVLVPYLTIAAFEESTTKKDSFVYLIAGIFVMMAVPISFWEIVQHMIHYTKPSLQKHIIRILWMVPIYAFNAWFGLVFPTRVLYLNSLRECYEAYVIYSFMKFLFNYLDDADPFLETTLAKKSQTKHIFPFCWMTNWRMGRELIHRCKHGILQYTIVRPMTSLAAIVCDWFGVYHEGELSTGSYPYIIAVNNVSQIFAMYCLVLFYRATKEELAPMKPIGKFLSIKCVIFFSFFQGVIITILVNAGVISQVFDVETRDSVREIASKLQNFLICIEMFLASIAHYFTFTHVPFINLTYQNPSVSAAFSAMWDVSDIGADLKEHFGIMGDSIRVVIGRGYIIESSESSSLISGPSKILPYYVIDPSMEVSDQDEGSKTSLSKSSDPTIHSDKTTNSDKVSKSDNESKK
ncbi:unnamed protein product [Bemisia tabaci]|uniref:Organic solute transporter ostalpha n=1 Tax=Bemisia tabaci TaxID=7038 RepID=A0A9P0AIR8_BEMTA|nr:PREDICTED: transmembrane protein 184C [Bemisia tabaci]CAH0393958.1 unnamed protein product [Bemisia tabaci]